MMKTAEFVISRSPVQVWSPAPCRFNHLQRSVGTAISRAVGTYVRLGEKIPSNGRLLGSMQVIAILVAIVVSAGCLAPSPPMPTAPTPIAQPSAPAPLVLGDFTVSAIMDMNGRSASMLLLAKDETGHRNMPIDASCTATAGTVSPARIVGDGSAMATLREVPPIGPVTITCRLANFDRSASTRLDFSAWRVSWVSLTEALNPRTLRWDTTAQISFDTRASGVQTTRRIIMWGDGRDDVLPNTTGGSTITMTHVYGRTGTIDATARVEWADGAGVAEARVRLHRSCFPDPSIAQFPGFPAPPDYGICTVSWSDLR